MRPGGFPAFLRGRMMAIFQIWGDFPVEKLGLKMPSSSCLALGPRALRNVGGISSVVYNIYIYIYIYSLYTG